MGCYKLEKIDKIVISFALIIVTFVCLFNTFSFASSYLPVHVIDDLYISNDSFVFQEGAVCVYFDLEKGAEYKITNNTGRGRTFRYSSFVPDVGVSINESFFIDNGSSKTFIANDSKLFVSAVQSNSFNYNDIEVELLSSNFNKVINNLSFDVGSSQLWKTFENSMPFILVVVLFSLGVWFIKHNIIEHSKGRDF